MRFYAQESRERMFPETRPREKRLDFRKFGFVSYQIICYIIRGSIVSEGGSFGSSIVFQDDAMVMLLYWRKCLLLVGERKFYGHVMAKDYTNLILG